MKNHKPETTVLFLGLLVASMYITPLLFKEDVEVVVAEEAPSWSELLDTSDVDLIVAPDTTSIDTTTIELEIDFDRWVPEYATHNTMSLPDSLRIYGTDSAKALLQNLFFKLETYAADSNAVDIFHFGDSQIEGDRITGRLRSSWQKSWGGRGPGLIPAIENVPALSVRHETLGIWDRYTRFGTIDSTLEHSCYGPLAVFSRVYENGTINLSPHPRGFKTNRTWDRVRVFTGESPAGGTLRISGANTELSTFDIAPLNVGGHGEISVDLGKDENSLQLEFTGHSVDVTGIDLGLNYGVKIHNIPMRGSAGMLFKKLDAKHFTKFMGSFEPSMFILQFGGNAAPYLSDSTSVAKYANRFGGQLEYLRAVWPEIPMLIIGPSDMGSSEDYPMVDNIIAEFKRVSLEQGCLFWDLKAVQGGEGSMGVWSEMEPAWASSDLVHFTPRGAKEIGRLLDIALRAEYKSWVEWRR